MSETFTTIDHALPAIYANLRQNGAKSSPRGLDTVEIEDYHFILTDPTQGITTSKDRALNYSLVALEFLSYAGGVGGTKGHAELNKQVAPNFAAFIDETTGIMNGAYGPRIGTQLQEVVSILTTDPDSRQAQVIISRPDEMRRVISPDHKGADKDFPCTNGFTFRIRDGKLNMSVAMRSNDLYWGTPYDVAAFTLIQRLVAAVVGVPVGRYSHYAASMHYYSTVVEKLNKIYGAGTHGTVTLTPLEFGYTSMSKAQQRFSMMIQDRIKTEQWAGCSSKVRQENMKPFEQEYAAQPDLGLWHMLTKRGNLSKK